MSTFDAHGVDADLSDLDQGLCQAYQRTIGSSTIEGMLRARDLVAGDGRSTVAAWLLFSERPQMIFPSAHVRVLKYADRERGSGSRMTLMAGHDIRFDGTLGHQINSAIKQVEEWLPRLQRLDSDGVFRDTAIIPTEAWKEGIINAVAHRSYSMHGDHIRIEIFPNRIEISNPGRFPGLVDLSEPTSIIRTARNPRIVRVLADMGIARELGEGISRMFDHMREAELVNPIYRQSSMGVTLILLDEPLPTRLTRPIKPAATRVFAAMREAGQPLGSAQVAELVGISKPTAIRHLNALREDGLVTWSGSKPNDPNATWALT
ncbi:MAG: helix-turn-helix domain-containing protein [Propionibacteriaceae bacterium]|jgi:ATP-dependent DNA helicase RecG|nr:helix-turn-helix domain-containing protein [Propionibacteriaceae bacterium]